MNITNPTIQFPRGGSGLNTPVRPSSKLAIYPCRRTEALGMERPDTASVHINLFPILAHLPMDKWIENSCKIPAFDIKTLFFSSYLIN